MTIAQIGFYDALDTKTRDSLLDRAARIDARENRISQDILENGREFAEARDELRHNKNGGFEGWVNHHGWARRTVYNYIKAYEVFGNCATVAQLPAKVIYLLAENTTPESVRAEVITRAERGETVHIVEARDLIEEEQNARRYDGFTTIPPPDDCEDEPLTPYEQQIAAQYERTEYAPARPAMSQAMDLLTRQTTVEWYTPPNIIELARHCLHSIDLDPASNATAQTWIRAAKYYTQDDNGLAMAWHGRVWLNPPFDDTGAWVDRLDSEYLHGDVQAAILLVNSAPGYNWWEDLWRRRPVCMLRERLCFVQANGAPAGQAKKGQTVAYYGEDIERFTSTFQHLGRIILPE